MKTKLILLSLWMTCTIFCHAQQQLPVLNGKFQATNESMKQYQYPTWFRDAKFGIWSHWGPQAVPRHGDWYAKKMYINDMYDRKTGQFTGKPDADYLYHCQHYGHPSEFGYKDLVKFWKAQRWDPEKLMELYKRVGARYFVSMGVHHDNFYLWDSQQTPWTSVKVGPHRDVVGEWQKAAKKNGMHFGVSEHLGASYTWFQTSRGCDKTGPKAGVPYDGNNEQYSSLYHEKCDKDDNAWLTKNPKFQMEWFYRIKELIDMYHPDLLYSDSKFPFEQVGSTLVSYYYNQDLQRNKNQQVVYTCKEESDGRFVRDVERGVIAGISPYPWQTDTSIGDWYYRTGQKYMSATQVIQMLVDIVSKNGNLLLNIVQTPEGDLEPDVLNILEDITEWMKDNNEAIYGTRPWSVFGEGPSLTANQKKGSFGGLKDVRDYQSGDLRFTCKGNNLYVFAMEHPTSEMIVESIPSNKKVVSVKMLGSSEKMNWNQGKSGLSIQAPKKMPNYNTLVFKIELASTK